MKRSASISKEQQARLKALGERLRRRARELKLSGAEVARRAGIAPRRYNHYVNGTRQPDPFALEQLSQSLGISLDGLLRGKSGGAPEHVNLGAVRHRQRPTPPTARSSGTLSPAEPSAGAGTAQPARPSNPYRSGSITDALRHAHGEVIPALLSKFRPRFLHTGMQAEGDSEVWLYVDGEFDPGPGPSNRAAAMAHYLRAILPWPETKLAVMLNTQLVGRRTIVLKWVLGRR